MKAVCKFKWEQNEIPPRCRKPRPVAHYKNGTANIPEANGDDADKDMPLAIVIHTEIYREKYD